MTFTTGIEAVIAVTMVGVNTYEVVVEKPTETVHRVTLRPEYYQKLTASKVTHEWLLIQSFKFLLEREPSSAILESFDLEDISGYFPEFEADIGRRLGV